MPRGREPGTTDREPVGGLRILLCCSLLWTRRGRRARRKPIAEIAESAEEAAAQAGGLRPPTWIGPTGAFDAEVLKLRGALRQQRAPGSLIAAIAATAGQKRVAGGLRPPVWIARRLHHKCPHAPGGTCEWSRLAIHAARSAATRRNPCAPCAPGVWFSSAPPVVNRRATAPAPPAAPAFGFPAPPPPALRLSPRPRTSADSSLCGPAGGHPGANPHVSCSVF